MIKQSLTSIPKEPGVYIMKDKRKRIIYIGKAKNLQNRVRSYFYSTEKDTKTALLVKNINSIDYIVTLTEIEALLLECSLIKKEQPKYNISLKDSKTYPFIKITITEPYPRVLSTRVLLKDKNLYFGPYTNARAVYDNIKLIHKLFPLRTCTLTLPSKTEVIACLDYHIQKCVGCCIDKISIDDYRKYIDKVILFLKGKHKKLVQGLFKKMEIAASKLLFEEANKIKKQLHAINEISQKQKVFSVDDIDIDIFGIHVLQNIIVISIMFIREGKLLGKRSFVFEEKDIVGSFNAINALSTAIRNYYSNNNNEIPSEILLPIAFETKELLIFLKALKHKKLSITIPKLGRKRDWVLIASHNAKFSYIERQKISEKELVLQELKKALHLSKEPCRIEGFDISNTDGTYSVASLVSFYDGRANKKEYRHFRIKTVLGPNDIASIAEVIARRYTKVKNKELVAPDLILVDGGKGQVSSAQRVLDALELKIPLIGLAKKEEEVFFPNIKTPLILSKDSPALKLLQAVRDEAHRFGNTFHKKIRGKQMLKSILDDINGVGLVKKKALLEHFKSVNRIKEASYEKLYLVDKIDKKTAQNVYEFFAKEK